MLQLQLKHPGSSEAVKAKRVSLLLVLGACRASKQSFVDVATTESESCDIVRLASTCRFQYKSIFSKVPLRDGPIAVTHSIDADSRSAGCNSVVTPAAAAVVAALVVTELFADGRRAWQRPE